MANRELNTLIDGWEQIYWKIESLPGYPFPDPNSIQYQRLKQEYNTIKQRMEKFSRAEINAALRLRAETARKQYYAALKPPSTTY